MRETATQGMDMRVVEISPVPMRIDRRLPMKLNISNNASAALSVSGSAAIPFKINGRIEYPIYRGPTTVIPNLVTQTLMTDAHVMPDNVTVKPIPYQETSNPAGGYTAIIGE